MKALLALLVLVAVVGCKKDEPTPTAAVSAKPPGAGVVPPVGGGNAGIAPLGSNVGGMTPISGGESVEGAGMGGIGQVAKNKARGAGTVMASPKPPDDDPGSTTETGG